MQPDQAVKAPVSDVKAAPIKDVEAPVPPSKPVNHTPPPVKSVKPKSASSGVIVMTVVIMIILIALAYLAYSKSKQ